VRQIDVAVEVSVLKSGTAARDDVASRGSWPAITDNASAASSTVVAIGPI
jgi:hypothetical protein